MDISLGPELLQGIIDNPNELNRRLIYADYLEETGDLVRSKFIRAQFTLRELSDDCPLGNQMDGCGKCKYCLKRDAAKKFVDYCAKYFNGWAGQDFPLFGSINWTWRWDYGFLDVIRLPRWQWMHRSNAINMITKHPIRLVELNDFAIGSTGGGHFCFVHTMPADIQKLIGKTVFDSYEEVIETVSAALLKWARQKYTRAKKLRGGL